MFTIASPSNILTSMTGGSDKVPVSRQGSKSDLCPIRIFPIVEMDGGVE